MLIDAPRDGLDAAGLADNLRSALMRQGAQEPRLGIEVVATIPRTTSGKAPLIRAQAKLP